MGELYPKVVTAQMQSATSSAALGSSGGKDFDSAVSIRVDRDCSRNVRRMCDSAGNGSRGLRKSFKDADNSVIGLFDTVFLVAQLYSEYLETPIPCRVSGINARNDHPRG